MVHIGHNKTMKSIPFKPMHESFIWWCNEHLEANGLNCKFEFTVQTLLTNQTPTTHMRMHGHIIENRLPC